MFHVALYLLVVLDTTTFGGKTMSEFWNIISTSNISYFEDSTRVTTFSEIETQVFTPGQVAQFNPQSIYWYRFTLNNNLNNEILLLHLVMSDFSNVMVPVKAPEKYKHYKVGLFARNKGPILQSRQLHGLQLETETIDFSRPFYFSRTMITTLAKGHRVSLPRYLFSDNKDLFNHYLMIKSYQDDRSIYFYLGLVLISFFLFLVNYFIIKDKSFLIYGLYLLMVFLYYANRQPFFLNLYHKTAPELFYYINELSSISSAGFYIWFIFHFLNFKSAFTKAYKLTLKLLQGILIFGVLYGLQIIVLPYFPYRFLVADVFSFILIILSVGLLLFLMFQKPDNIAKIVLLGSLILAVGSALSFLGDYFIFLRLMGLEIILFAVVMALRNKQIDQRRIRNRYHLELANMRVENLKELDATKTRFYENITHEFRTPLTLILSPIEKKLKQPQICPNEKKELNIIQRNAKRLLSLVSQMLYLAKLEEGNVNIVIKKGDLHTLLQTLIDGCRQEAAKKNICFTSDSQELATAWFDQDIVEKIVTNLFSNAIKHTVEGGSITLESYASNGYWVLKAVNSIDPDVHIDVTKLYTRYYRASGHTEGSGIGLNITKELVELVHGSIEATILPTNKIQFIVSLPIEKSLFPEHSILQSASNNQPVDLHILQSTTTENQESTLNEATVHSSGKEHIRYETPKLLVVEDNPDMRELIVSSFKDNYKIWEAENGKTGLELAQKHLPDIIISDVMMPTKDGFELCDAIKQNPLTNHIPFVLLTAKVGEENQIKGFEAGADDYISKPFHVDILILKINNLLATRKRIKSYFSKTFDLTPELSVNSHEQEFLNRLKEATHNHITKPELTSGEFALIMGMSRSQLHKKLHAVLGVSTSEYIRSQRLKMAVELLKTSDLGISEISYLVGFNTPSYFNKCFKETYGTSPGEYLSRSDQEANQDSKTTHPN